LDEVLQESTTLRGDVTSARAARRFLRRALESWRCDAIADLVLLAANELVTNAVIHARSAVDLRVQLSNRVVRIEVVDRDPRPPVPRHAPDDATGGRGLAVVEAVASRWGVDPIEGGKRVWFEVPS
jgi:anti-sigma regulatory factor (Ser/Thr protein kinase)